jgi:hypothetical protein
MLSKIKIIENLEQRSEEWLNLRLGRIGGSSAFKLTSDSRYDTLFYEKLTEILTASQIEGFTSKAMQRGIDQEPYAKAQYELENSVQVREVGYILNEDYRYAGLSPDGLVGRYGGIEIKNPTSKVHIKTCLTEKVPEEYLYQIAWYFIIYTKLRWVDFVSYDDRVSFLPYFQKRVKPEDILEYIDLLKEKYFKFENDMDYSLTKIGFFDTLKN